MDRDFTIRPADAASPPARACMGAYFDELARIFPGGFDPGPPGDPAELSPPQGVFLLAWQGDAAMGCVALRRLGPAVGEVKRLWVAPAARGRGLAQTLMAAVEDRARGFGFSRLCLDTSRHLPAAVAFYRRAGWAEIPRYNDNPYAHHWFSRAL
ncbi:MAG: GNAT family N-acetyltransferase [Paracoccaceae bacterium]